MSLLKRLSIIIFIKAASLRVSDIDERYLKSIKLPNVAPINNKLIPHIANILNRLSFLAALAQFISDGSGALINLGSDP